MDASPQRLRESFPQLARIAVQDGATSHLDALPPFLASALSVMASPPKSPVCFVLPRAGEIPRLAAVLHGLGRLAAARRSVAAPDLAAFRIGERVLVHPSREVFVFQGAHSEPGYFQLGELDRNEPLHLALPLSALGRLERTIRQRPKGEIGRSRHIQKPLPAWVDALLGTATFGNLGSIANEVVLLDTKTGFKGLVDELVLQGATAKREMPPLGKILPFGTLELGAAGRPVLEKYDATGLSGEPLLAVANSAELAACHCLERPEAARLVVANGLKYFSDLQSFDDLVQHARLVLFADRDDGEAMATLAARGCQFWFFETGELLAGANGTSRTSLVGSVARWSRNAEALQIDDEPCEDAAIDELSLRLDGLRGRVDVDDDGPAARLIATAWGTFSRLRSTLQPPSPEERNRSLVEIEAFRLEVRRHAAWFDTALASSLVEIAGRFTTFFAEGSQLGNAKGAALKRALEVARAANQRVAILAKDEYRAEEVRKWLCDRALPADTPVFSIRRFPDGEAFDRLLCVSWPNGDAMRQIAGRLAAPRITLVGYPCERHWLRKSQSRLGWRPPVPGISLRDKEALLNSAGTKLSWASPVPAAPPAAPEPDPEIWNFERRLRGMRVGLAASPTSATDTLPARYVRFAGEYYCFLTETHRVPIATELVSGTARKGQKLPERTVEEIKPGDFVVFPESGDREVLHELADKMAGRQAQKLRRQAHAWKDALTASGIAPDEFHRTACDLDMRHNPATIRHWFAESAQIGPKFKEDLVLIGLVTGNKAFEAQIDDTWMAIEALRSFHLSAGMRLRDVLLQRLPETIGHVEENGTVVDLGELGSARVVQVEAVAAEFEPRGRSEINRLLSERNADPFGGLL